MAGGKAGEWQGVSRKKSRGRGVAKRRVGRMTGGGPDRRVHCKKRQKGIGSSVAAGGMAGRRTEGEEPREAEEEA